MATTQLGGPYNQSNAESWRGDYSQMPPEQAMQERAIARKQQIMNLLISKGLGNTQHQETGVSSSTKLQEWRRDPGAGNVVSSYISPQLI